MEINSDYYTHSRPEIFSHIPDDVKTILDVGCSKGKFLKLVKQKTNAETWGIDMIETDKENKEYIDNFIQGNVETVLKELPNEYFDCITFNDVLEHLLEPKDILEKIVIKLKDDGIILASIPNFRFIFNLYEILIKRDWQYKIEGILDSTHIRFFTKKSMLRLFDEAGYTVIEHYGINKNKTTFVRLFNIITFGYFSDTLYLQFLIKARKRTF